MQFFGQVLTFRETFLCIIFLAPLQSVRMHKLSNLKRKSPNNYYVVPLLDSFSTLLADPKPCFEYTFPTSNPYLSEQSVSIEFQVSTPFEVTKPKNILKMYKCFSFTDLLVFLKRHFINLSRLVFFPARKPLKWTVGFRLFSPFKNQSLLTAMTALRLRLLSRESIRMSTMWIHFCTIGL